MNIELLDIAKLKFVKVAECFDWTIVLNCGDDIQSADGVTLPKFTSGLFKDIKITGKKLLKFEIGGQLELTAEQVIYCRRYWQPVFDIFPVSKFKDVDFYRSPKVKLGNFEFNFWYCDKDFNCGIHNKHDFFELHTQILGAGQMLKFHNKSYDTIFYKELLSPGQTHQPFFDKNGKYPYHQYKSISPCIWLAIESKEPLFFRSPEFGAR